MGNTSKGKDQVVATATRSNQPGPNKNREPTPASTDTNIRPDQMREASAPASSSGKPDSGQEGNLFGIVSNEAPITEEEAEQVLVPEAILQEEERLRHEHDNAADPPGSAAGEEEVLSSARFQQLDHLLSKTDMYTSFLKEQMEVIQKTATAPKGQQEATAAEEAGPSGRSRGKRKSASGKGGARGGKCQKGPAACGATPRTGESDEGGKTPTQELVPLIAGELRDYQLAGVRWLISLYQNGVNGILADQMGLGKTVQTVGFLSHLWANGVYGPHLILGPLSTLPNWVAEVERWCPSMPVVLYHGSKEERANIRAKRMPIGPITPFFPIIVTSYEVVLADIKVLSHYHYKYIVVDEGHRLKNFNCRLLRELKTLTAQNKLLLTGTPLQNSLSELWSLLNFLMPEIFTNLADFEGWFDFGTAGAGKSSADQRAVAAEQRHKVVAKLHGILRPFLLRRMKSDVEIALPRKQEVLLYAAMAPHQKSLSQQLVDKTLTAEMAKLANEGAGTTSALGKLNNVLMQARKICNHPDLLTAPFSGELEYPTPAEMVAQCGKMALLERLLDRLRAAGHKVLIFSQMTKMLDLIESYLDQRGFRACRIDGSIPWQVRQENIQDFNGSDPDTWVFLLSTRAGGLAST